MAALTTAAGACPGSVRCLAYGQAELGLWAPKVYKEQEKTGTVIVVQIINTVLDTTSYSTVAHNIPSVYVPPLTNEGGTKIASVIYEHRGTVFTTTVAYPTPFLSWQDSYRIEGGYELQGSTGSKSCVTGANKTLVISSHPQPPWRSNDPNWDVSKYFDPKDPLGWAYSYDEETRHGEAEPIIDIIDLLPEDNPDMPHSAVKQCTMAEVVAPYVVEANANWRVVAHTSVLYEGGDGSAKDGSAAHHTADPVGGAKSSHPAGTRPDQVVTFNGGHGVAEIAGAPTSLPSRVVQGHDAAATTASQSGGSVAYKPFLFPLWTFLWASYVAGHCGSL
ncbi:hypothetical protein B0T14DRAFT_497661 [Immersiella caudata]|uniref:Uncharacterized protein n=1 Tax=Immersiella caudata TaxID=314043 RepID=A0AA39WJA5_9PEZI|nr:hypothetical protein B0T14DRAFT_497661 [Immersiella caudata]